MKQCDHGHEVPEYVDLRLLPTSFDDLHGNIICCYTHYLKELKYRSEQGQKDTRAFPEWDNLTIYKEE